RFGWRPQRESDRVVGAWRPANWTYPDLVERSVLRSSHVTGTLPVPSSSFVRAASGARSFIPAHTCDSPDARRGPVKIGRRANVNSYCGISRPHLDRPERGG